MKIEEIRANDRNPRKIRKESLDKLVNSITELPKMMALRPIIIDKDNMILAGNMRYEALKTMGYKEISAEWVKKAEDLTEEEKKRFIVADNLSFGDWDMDILKTDFDMGDLESWGFEDFELGEEKESIEETVGDDETPGFFKECKTVLGDLYELGNHRLLCGDSTLIDDVEKLMDGNKADLCITDPPYNVDYVVKTKEKLKIQNDKMTGAAFYDFLLDAFVNIYAVSNDGASLYVFHADTEGISFRTAFVNAGYKLSSCCIWVKQSLVMGRSDYHWQHEPILYGWKNTASHNWYSDRKQTTLWEFNMPVKSDLHQTTKPIDIIVYPITNSSIKDNIVLDAFLGSGSTLIACEKSERRCFGLELEPKYCDVIVKRYIDYCKKNGKQWSVKLNGEDISKDPHFLINGENNG